MSIGRAIYGLYGRCISLRYLKLAERWGLPVSKRWNGTPVFIYSKQHRQFWRPGGCGYTPYGDQAGRWSFEEAKRTTWRCGPEKKIVFNAVGGFGW